MDITCRLARAWLRCVTIVLLLWLRMGQHVASVDIVNLKPANASVRVGSSLILYCRYVLRRPSNDFLWRFVGVQVEWRKHLPGENVSLWNAANFVRDSSPAINKVSDGLLAYNITSEFSASTDEFPKINQGHDLIISNLKKGDAGTYSCLYSTFHSYDEETHKIIYESNQAVVTVGDSSHYRLSSCMNRNCSGLGYCVETTVSYKSKCVCEFGITGQDCETEFDEELPDCESHSTIGHEAINRTHFAEPDATTKLWTFVHTQPFESEGTIKTIEFFAFDLNTLEVGLYKPVSERLCHLQMEQKIAVTLIEEGYNKIDFKHHSSEMRFRRGYYFGFTWRYGEVIPYDSTERTEYCEGGVHPGVGDVLNLHADDSQSRRKYSINVMYKHELCDLMSCESQPCFNGSCVEAVGSYECRCKPGYSGLNCETDIDECLKEDCGRVGTCIDLVNDFKCQCITGFTGRHCRTNIDDCEGVDCSGKGTCVDHYNKYECVCKEDFTGKTCETKIDDCKPSSCYQGTCYDLVNSFRCDCLDGYTGKFCEKVIDYCLNVTCSGHGKCSKVKGGYFCRCETGYRGEDCEEEIDHCEFVTCEHGSCVNSNNGFNCNCQDGYVGQYCSEERNPCKENENNCNQRGKCKHNGPGNYTCECSSGYIGQDCEIFPCQGIECSGHGSCVNEGIVAFCKCSIGYTGKDCSTNIDHCEDQYCSTDGSCIDLLYGYKCNCDKGFKGRDCEIVDIVVRIFGYSGALLEGDELSMTCITNHLEIKLTYKWVFLQPRKTFPSVVSETESYRKKGITEQDAGQYQCEVTVPSSPYHSSTSADYFVNVTVLPSSSNEGSSQQRLTKERINGTSLLIGMAVGGVIIALLVICVIVYIKHDSRKRARDVEDEKLFSDVGFYMHGPSPIAPEAAHPF